MAKDDKKPNKAKFKGVASKDVRKRYRKSKKQWEKAKSEGKGKKAKKAYKRMKSTRKEVKRREQKQYEKMRLDTAMEEYNMGYNMLSPSQKKTIDTLVEEFDPDMIKKYGIGPKARKNIMNDAKKAAKEKYGIKLERLDEDYDTTLKNDIHNIEKELERSQRDLEQAISENNSYAAEIIKAEQRGLGDSLTEAKNIYQTQVQNKNDYLEKQLSNMQESLDTGLGRTSEDEITKLRQLEREYTRQLDTLQTDASEMGIAFSSKRFSEEEYLGETTEEQKMLTQREADRSREDLNRLYGTEAQKWEQRLTADELQEMAMNYGVDMRTMIQQVEQKIGTQAAQSIIPQDSQGYLIGGQTGSVNWETGQSNKAAKNKYADTAQDLGDWYTQTYGTDAFNQQFGQAFNSAAADFTYTGQQGVAGSANTTKERTEEDLKQEKKDYKQEYYDTMVGNVNPNVGRQ